MHILFATAELSPFSNASDVADNVRQMAAELKLLGHDVSIITPLYRWISPAEHHLAHRLQTLRVPLDGNEVEAGLLEGRTPEGVRTFFIECSSIFGRHKNIYTTQRGDSYRDNDVRFGLFARFICEFIRSTSVNADILHLAGWSCGLVPVFLEECYAEDDLLADVMVVQDVTDLSPFRFNPAVLDRLGLPDYLNHPDHLAVGEEIDYLKGGVLFSDMVTLQSETFARELQTRAQGGGLEEAFREREEDLHGIPLGIDPLLLDPATDELLPQQYDSEHLNGKRQCKASLQHELGLAMRPRNLVVGLLGELSERSGAALFCDAFPDLDTEHTQFVVVGRGDRKIERRLEGLTEEHGRAIAVKLTNDPALMRRALAGCDVVLFPRRVAPSALEARVAQRYATLPIAMGAGDFADTITDATDDSGNGFLFDKAKPAALAKAISRAATRYQTQRYWRARQLEAMTRLLSRKESARRLVRLYEELL